MGYSYNTLYMPISFYYKDISFTYRPWPSQWQFFISGVENPN